MTDLEISKALALAIGWKPEQIHKNLFIDVLQVIIRYNGDYAVLQAFDYRDWNVIGPIAAKYDCFPCRNYTKRASWGALFTTRWTYADTPQKAIALAVINGVKL